MVFWYISFVLLIDIGTWKWSFEFECFYFSIVRRISKCPPFERVMSAVRSTRLGTCQACGFSILKTTSLCTNLNPFFLKNIKFFITLTKLLQKSFFELKKKKMPIDSNRLSDQGGHTVEIDTCIVLKITIPNHFL